MRSMQASSGGYITWIDSFLLDVFLYGLIGMKFESPSRSIASVYLSTPRMPGNQMKV